MLQCVPVQKREGEASPKRKRGRVYNLWKMGVNAPKCDLYFFYTRNSAVFALFDVLKTEFRV